MLLAALLVAVLGLVLLGPAARGQDPCNVLLEDCATTTTEDDLDRTTTTEDDDDETTTTRDGRDVTRTTQAEREEPEELEEVTTTSTITVTTLRDVLIPGDGTAGAESTTTTTPVTAGDDGVSDETLILVVVLGLAVAASVVGVLTYRYWQATRPLLVEAPTQRPPRAR